MLLIADHLDSRHRNGGAGWYEDVEREGDGGKKSRGVDLLRNSLNHNLVVSRRGARGSLNWDSRHRLNHLGGLTARQLRDGCVTKFWNRHEKVEITKNIAFVS